MSFAIVENGVVTNIAEGPAQADNWVEVTKSTGKAKRGYTWDGNVFSKSKNHERNDKLRELDKEAGRRRGLAGVENYTEDQLAVIELIRATVKESSLDKAKTDTDAVAAIEVAYRDAQEEIKASDAPVSYDVVNDPNWP